MRSSAIPGYENAYEIREDGTVLSLPREVLGRDGTVYPFKAKQITPIANKRTGYFQVSLWKNNKGTWFYIHRLLAQAFIPNPEGKPEVNHKDGNRQNNSLDNLEWATRIENAQHAVRTGLRTYTNRLTRDEFIECLQSVIEGESYQSLSNRTPYQVPFLSTKLRKIAKEEQIEYLLDSSLKEQKIMRARINGVKNRG